MRSRRHPRSIRRQRGAAALVVTMLLVFAMLIVVAVANRNAIVETRASANQYRSTQSFEAAEAGLEWALARLNDNAPIGDDCLPSADPAAPSFRERYLRDDGAGFVAATWDDAGTRDAAAGGLRARRERLVVQLPGERRRRRRRSRRQRDRAGLHAPVRRRRAAGHRPRDRDRLHPPRRAVHGDLERRPRGGRPARGRARPGRRGCAPHRWRR